MAVYTEVTAEDLDGFLAAYDAGGALVFKGIAEGVENTNYFLRTERGAFILTLYEKRVRAGDLPFFLGLMEHLAAHGTPCSTPVRGRDGRVFRTLNRRPAALLTFLDGVSFAQPTPEHCERAGHALAQLHLAGADFPFKRINALNPAGWKKLAMACAADADTVMTGMAALIALELEHLSNAWPHALPEGVIHADLFPDNVLFVENRLSGLIDFYFACNDALAYDVAVMLNSWCFDENGAFNIDKSRALLAGYQSVRRFEPAERAAMPVLARGAALRFLLTRLYDWLHHDSHALVRPKDPCQFVRNLRFHRAVSGPEAYGL
ncbi:MAG: homoserine kinase [Alphaproteobacteria bacterium]